MSAFFETTAWSVIAAAQGGDSTASRAALEVLCSRYWSPLYIYVRQKGYARPEAEDLTQEFFVHLLTRDLLAQVHPDRGRFRTFLLTCMNHFLQDEWARSRSARRGGGLVPISLDIPLAERQLSLLYLAGDDPHKVFDREWAETLLGSAFKELEAEYSDAGRLQVFRALHGCLGGNGNRGACGHLGEQLGMSAGAVRTAVHRMRRRFAELTRAEIARTVDGAAAVQEELDYLLEVVSG